MIAATVLIPTHQHVATLRQAVRSVQAQSIQDFELFIVGDGVTDATRALVAELAGDDDRIRFFDFPKGPRKGERHRHTALQEARGRIVAYLGDDDCWMPNHLAVLDDLLTDADFGHTLQLGVDEQGETVALPAALEDPNFRRRMLSELFNRFDLTFGAHTLDAYRRLPHGWHTTPAEFPWTDLYMWRQFLEQPWCRARSAMIPTGINTWTHKRPRLTDQERADDLARWHSRISDADYREQLCTDIIRRFAGESVTFELLALERKSEVDRLASEVDRLASEVEMHARAAHLMRASKSWRLTAPLRSLRSRAARR